MKNRKWLKVATVALLLVSISRAKETEKVDRFDIIIGGGAVSSSGYQDYVDDAYTAHGYTGTTAKGWLDLYAGVEFRPFKQFGIIAGCDAWINGLEPTGGGSLDESDFMNTLFIPSLYGQLYLTSSRLFYVNVGINFPIPTAGSTFFDFEATDSIGWGANIGVELFDLLRIEGGYSSVPVTVKSTPSNPFSLTEEYNFGGPQLRVLLAF